MARAKRTAKPAKANTTVAASRDDDAANAVLARIDNLIPSENRREVAVIIEETFSKISHHSGPLPAPTDLAAYEAIQSGFAERIMRMAENEQSNRLRTLSQVVDRDYRERGRGQHYALASVVVLAGLAAFVAYLGNTNAAAWVATAAIVGIVGIFVTGRLAPVRDVDYEADETPQG